VLTEVTGRPKQLIRRLPNRLILMSVAYLVYDFPCPEAQTRIAMGLSSTALKDREWRMILSASRC
jgi:hypothetical protein